MKRIALYALLLALSTGNYALFARSMPMQTSTYQNYVDGTYDGNSDESPWYGSEQPDYNGMDSESDEYPAVMDNYNGQ